MKIIDMLVGAYSEKPHVESIEQSQYVVQHGNKPTQYFSSAAAMEAYCKECEREDQARAKQQAAIDKVTGRNKEYLKAINKKFDHVIPNENYRIAIVTDTGDAHCSAWQSYVVRDEDYDAQLFKFSIPGGVRVIGLIVLDEKQIIRAAMPLTSYEFKSSWEFSVTLTYNARR